MGGRTGVLVAVVVVIAAAALSSKRYGIGFGSLDRDSVLELFGGMKDRLGLWAIPAYVGFHTLTLALCLPYAVFFEAGASILFGFFPAVLCVFSAKILGASLSFFIGRLVFKSSSSAVEWAHKNKYFHVLSKGVERDGWKFVLLARFSPIPSYVINYALAATKVRFILDFLLPTVIGCLPMILQNTSIGSLASAAVSSTTGSQKSKVWSYIFPLLGIMSSILISIRIKKYSADLSVAVSSLVDPDLDNDVGSSTALSKGPEQRSRFFVDNVPIRAFRNSKELEVKFPFNQPMKIYSSLWNADDWTTRGGLEKTDWSKQPFMASERGVHNDGTREDRLVSWHPKVGSTLTGVSPLFGPNTVPLRARHGGIRRNTRTLMLTRLNCSVGFAKKWTIYNYCRDPVRYPKMSPECVKDRDVRNGY